MEIIDMISFCLNLKLFEANFFCVNNQNFSELSFFFIKI